MTHNNYISSLLYNLYRSIMFIHPSIRLVHLSIYPSMFLPLPQLTLLHLNPNFHLETKTVHPSIHPSNVPIYSSMNSTFTYIYTSIQLSTYTYTSSVPCLSLIFFWRTKKSIHSSSIHLSINCKSIYPYIAICFYASTHFFPSVLQLFIFNDMFMYFHLSINVHPPIYIHLSFHIHLSIHPPIPITVLYFLLGIQNVHPSIHPSTSIHLPIYIHHLPIHSPLPQVSLIFFWGSTKALNPSIHPSQYYSLP